MSLLSDAPIQYAHAGDVNIAYQVMGHGPVTIVYVPGLLNLIEATAEVPAIERHFERMAAFSRIIIFDKRGTGLSDRVPSGDVCDVELRLEDVRAVMDANGLDKAILFGTAEATMIAILFAARYPERVGSLILLEATARWVVDEGYDIGVPLEARLPVDFWLEHWGNAAEPQSVDILAPSMVKNPRWREALARMQRRAATPAAAYEYWEETVRTDVRAVLQKIAVPTLVMHCAGDRLFPVAQGRFVAEAIPGARFVELPGRDHFPWFENGDRVAAETEEFLLGSRRAVSGSQRVSTVLFTDLVGSTEIATRLGDARWRDLIEDHDRMIQREVSRFGGRVVKTTGDGVLAVFDDPAAAILCGLGVCESIRALGLEARAAAHTGLVESRGDDVAGIAVNIAARVLAEARPSEILVTRTVRDLLMGSSLQFSARGVRRLKGVPDEWEIYASAF